MRNNTVDFKRIAFWAKQPVFTREVNGLLDVVERANRLKRMHEEFGTEPEVPKNGVDRMAVESRNIVYEMFQCVN